MTGLYSLVVATPCFPNTRHVPASAQAGTLPTCNTQADCTGVQKLIYPILMIGQLGIPNPNLDTSQQDAEAP